VKVTIVNIHNHFKLLYFYYLCSLYFWLLRGQVDQELFTTNRAALYVGTV
jgi:hypothetical protein